MVFIGDYTIVGTEVHLSMSVTYAEDQANLKIYLPKDYPFTRLKVALCGGCSIPKFRVGIGFTNSNREPVQGPKPLFEARIGYLPHGLPYYTQQDVNSFFNRYRIDLRKPTLHILNIRVNARTFPNLLPDERSMISGLGKKAFCRAIPILAKHWGLVASDPVTLTAAGGMVNTQQDRDRVREYEKDEKMQLVNRLLKIMKLYPGIPDYSSEMSSLLRETKANLARSLVAAENNQHLINYYARAWAMKPIVHKGIYHDMGTSLGQLEEACGINTIITKY